VENRFLEMQAELKGISARTGSASGAGADASSFSRSPCAGVASTVARAHALCDDAGGGNAMTVSDAGVELVKGWEGFAPKLYNDPVGHCRVGYGTLIHLGNCDGRDSEQPYANGVSKEAAMRLLASALAEQQAAVSNAVKVPLNQNQYDALVSFACNVGSGSLQKSTLLRLLNQGRYQDVPVELKKWTKVRTDGRLIDLPGLVKRRAGEAALFMQPAAASVAQSAWSLQQDAVVVSPFPARFADPLTFKDDKKLGDSFRVALKAVKDNPDFAGLPGIDELPIILVPLNADKTRPFLGLHYAEQFYAGSMLKIAAMFAAFQLRHAVNQLAATLDSTKVTDQGKFFAAVRKAFDDPILKASDLIRKAGTTGNRAPQYDRIFTAAQDGAGKWSVKFRADADPKLNFDGHLKNMIVNSHNPSAGFCIQALGFSWIDGLLQKAGLFDAAVKRGIWLAGDYLDTKAAINAAHADPAGDADRKEEFDLGISGWSEVRIPSKNDGPSKQATTCIDAARLLVLLFDDKLVATTDPVDTANADMLSLLAQAVTGAGAPTIVGRFPAAPAPFAVLQSKIGVGTLGNWGSCNRDPVTNHTNGCVLSESMIVQQAAAPQHKFAVVWQNVRDAGNDGFKQIARIRDLIQKTMDGY
jgi:GH24 family phage-related lysozyme (muramidase)